MINKWFFLLPVVLILVGIRLFFPAGKPPGDQSRVTKKTIVWSQPKEIKAPTERWSENITTPSGLFKIVPARGKKAEILFSNGSYYLLDSFEQADMGYVSGNFRLRGVSDGKDESNKAVTVYLYTAK